jgi:hypothetical protein
MFLIDLAICKSHFGPTIHLQSKGDTAFQRRQGEPRHETDTPKVSELYLPMLTYCEPLPVRQTHVGKGFQRPQPNVCGISAAYRKPHCREHVE